MNVVAENRYSRSIRVPRLTTRPRHSVASVALGVGLEHLEHAVGHDEAADHVQRGQDDREESEHLFEGWSSPRRG